MSQQNSFLQFQSNSHYPAQEKPEKVLSQKKSKKTQSNMSTRKSSADSIDLRVKFKTEMCKYFLLEKECPFSELCLFAHGEAELRSKDFLPNNYKTKECSKFSSEGYCPYGTRCQFIHSQRNHNIKYEQIVETLRNNSQVFYQFLTQNQIKKPRRLSFFQQMEPLEQIKEKTEEQVVMYNLANQMLAVRTRHNSI